MGFSHGAVERFVFLLILGIHQEMEAKSSNEALDRKCRAEALLRAANVPVNPHLPAIEDSSEALVRTKEEVAARAMALLIVAARAEGLELDFARRLVERYGLANELSPNERRFLANAEPSEFDRTQFIWRYEAAGVLLWALGYVQELTPPTTICDVPQAVEYLRQRTRAEFIADAKLRPIAELLDATDLVYRYHWAAVNARLNGLKTPADIDASVVLERHYALNWLVGYMGQEWDDVSPDT